MGSMRQAAEFSKSRALLAKYLEVKRHQGVIK